MTLAALKFCFKTCVAMKFMDDDDDDDFVCSSSVIRLCTCMHVNKSLNADPCHGPERD